MHTFRHFSCSIYVTKHYAQRGGNLDSDQLIQSLKRSLDFALSEQFRRELLYGKLSDR